MGTNMKKMTEEEMELYKRENRRDVEIHRKMVGLVRRGDVKVREKIEELFKVKRGVRPIAIQKRYPKFDAPYVWHPDMRSTVMLSIGEMSSNNLGILEKNYGQIHFYETIFDDLILDRSIMDREVLDEIKRNMRLYEKLCETRGYMAGLRLMRSRVYNRHIIGIGFVFDIDSPSHTKNNDDEGGKVDCFQVWDQFMVIKNKVEWWLDSFGLKYRCIFSGNGIYIKVEDCYFKSIEDYNSFIREMGNIVERVNHWADQYYKYSGKLYPRIDNKGKSWWSYDKIWFTYHTKWNRVTIPLGKGYVDRYWVEKVTDIDRFIENVDIYMKEIDKYGH